MSNLIKNNAYRILGLDSSANQKDVLKRYKEIINRLKIDDYPEYDLDINLPEKFRTEESVNDALKKLQNIKNNLTEYFFWFNIADTVDENAFDYLQYNDATSYSEAVLVWKNASDTEISTGLLYKKNLTLLYCLMLLNEENDIYLKESLSNWKEIIDSDKFWTTFEKSYAINNDQTINSDIIFDFRENIVKYISDIYHDLYLQHGNKKYVKDFQDVFGTLGEKTEENLLKPIHQSIYDIIEQLKKINLKKTDESNDDVMEKVSAVCDSCGRTSERSSSKRYFDYDNGSILCKQCHKKIGNEWQEKYDTKEVIEGHSSKIKQIHEAITKLKSELDRLHEIGLYDDEQSKVVRDHAAEAIRDISIMIHNEADMREKSIKLLDLAKEIAGTESVKQQLEPDSNVIKENIKRDITKSLKFEVGGFLRKKNLLVSETFIKYNSKKIFYQDVISIGMVQNENDYVFLLNSHNDKMKIKVPSWDSISGIYSHMSPAVDHIIVKKLVKLIFDDDLIISIGKINFDKNGYHTSKLFRNKSVSWEDKLKRPELGPGYAILWQIKGYEVVASVFEEVELKHLNAIVIPEFAEACYNEYHARNQNGV